MKESNKILLFASGLYLIVAVTGFYFGIAFDKSIQVYEIIAYLTIYQIFVIILLCEPLSKLAIRYKFIMIGIIALIIYGQLINDSRKFYPLTSWTMYSSPNTGAPVILIQALNKEFETLDLKMGQFSPARSSRPHAQLSERIILNRDEDQERFSMLMNYYCKVLEKEGRNPERLQIKSLAFNSNGNTREIEYLADYKCDEP